jgi:hypothetical protein
MSDDSYVDEDGTLFVKKAGPGQFDFPALYEYFYEDRNTNLFSDFTFDEFVDYLKNHT